MPGVLPTSSTVGPFATSITVLPNSWTVPEPKLAGSLISAVHRADNDDIPRCRPFASVRAAFKGWERCPTS